MTVVCYRCGLFMGEKCPECGQEPAVKMVFKGVNWLCLNSNCQTSWFKWGTGGTSHGLCEPCEKIEREQL